MRALVYDPYLDTLGGGERYALFFAIALKDAGFTVDLVWPDKELAKEAEKRFGFDLSGINFSPDAFAKLSPSSGLFSKKELTSRYDLCFWVSDGSLPFLFSRKNFIHFQVPFKKIGGSPFLNLVKSLNVDKYIFNSQFTADIIKKQLLYCPGTVLYPPIDTAQFTAGKKENLILSVARFDSPSHAKRQDVLIEAFARLYEKSKDYRLVLTGGLKGGEEYLSSLKTAAGKLPVTFLPNSKFSELKKLYASARFFWHAAGLGIDERNEPEKVEHFGMTTVEAMSAGCIPVVINKGGQKEIIVEGSGFLCASPDEIVTRTLSLIEDPGLQKSFSEKASQRAQEFSQENFARQVRSLF